MAVMSATRKNTKISPKGRERSGLDTMAFNEIFPGSTINTSQWNQSVSTMTIAQASGAITLNNGASGTSGAYAILQSYAGQGAFGGLVTWLEFKFSLGQALQPNSVVEIGAGYVATTAAPTDGIFLRLNGTTIQLVLNNNGTEIVYSLPNAVKAGGGNQVGAVGEASIQITTGQRYHLEIMVSEDLVEWWLNGIFMGGIAPNGTPLGAGSGSLGLITSSNSWPLVARVYNSGAVGTPQTLSLYETCVLNGDADDVKPWPDVMACAGCSLIQGRTGGTVGQLANYANSAAPASATLSNTAAGYTTLGGQWQFAAVGGAETDYALFAWQNPAGTAAVPGSQVHIKRIRISAWVMGAASATTPTLLQWAAGAGATAVSLATADSASAKGPRRVTLGSQSIPVGAAIGANVVDIDITLDTPLVINPGEFFHLILKMPVGTATASEIIRGLALINGYAD